MARIHSSLNSNNNGFTLIELIITVAIIGVLAAIAIPAYKGYVTTSKIKAAESVLEQFPVLIESYRAENGIMCPLCSSGGPYIYSYKEHDTGVEYTAAEYTAAGLKSITTDFPDFRAKGLTADVSLYDYEVTFTIGPPESAKAKAIVVPGRGAPPGDIDGNTYQ